jgi:hypothetical protein
VFVEHSGHGGTWAAPITKHLLETFFAKQDGKPLPPPPVKQGAPPAPADGDDPPLLPSRIADSSPATAQPRP